MKHFLQLIPIPICGIMLAIVSLGNLLQATFTNLLGMPGLGYLIYISCFFLTLIFLILILLKIIFCFKMVVQMLKNPEIAGIFSAYSLTLMIFAGYLPQFLGNTVAEIVWWFGVLMHYTNMVLFTYKFVVVDFKLPTLLPPWYVVYVGFALSGFSAKNFAPGWFGAASFWFGFICFWIIFFMLLKRYKVSPIPRMDEPTLCINAALGICLTNYLRNFDHPWFFMVFGLFIIELIIWLWLIFKLPKWLKLPFYPTDSAFSFPFVVAAIASMETMKFLMNQGFMIHIWFEPLILIQTFVAVIMTIYALVRYIIFIVKALKNKDYSSKMAKMNMTDVARDMDMHEGIKLQNS